MKHRGAYSQRPQWQEKSSLDQSFEIWGSIFNVQHLFRGGTQTRCQTQVALVVMDFDAGKPVGPSPCSRFKTLDYNNSFRSNSPDQLPCYLRLRDNASCQTRPRDDGATGRRTARLRADKPRRLSASRSQTSRTQAKPDQSGVNRSKPD